MKGYGSPILSKYISCYSLSACVVLMSLLQIENFTIDLLLVFAPCDFLSS